MRPIILLSSASTGGTEGSSPASSPVSAESVAAMAAPKFGTLVPNRIFVGGISASTSEAELTQLFSAYGNVKNTKIISDRAGVSKGYGFVTFETDEEAKKLQRESECIILRERKLNIAPAIKKQPLNRSFDGGSGSPPAVPASTYYYANGMGLTYQNGLAFYNAGAPAPGTPIAPPTDPTTIYQAAGVFNPQASSAHQTFAPLVYSCPAPSLYLPQQYPYSPMPYESYFAGAGGASGPTQYALYTTSPANSQEKQDQQKCQGQNGNGSVSGAPGIGGSVETASPPSLGSLPIPSGHYYASSGPPPPPPPPPPQPQPPQQQQQQHHHHHHHPPPPLPPPPPPPPPIAAVPPQQPQQIDYLYYSFATSAPPPQQQQTNVLQTQQQQQQQQQQQYRTIGIAEQPMLLYATDPMNCQQLTNPDSRTAPQEDTISVTSQSERMLLQHENSNETHQQEQRQNRETQQIHRQQSFATSSHLSDSLMPLKYPIVSARYANYHPIASPTNYTITSSGIDRRDRSERNQNVTSRSNIVNYTNFVDTARYHEPKDISCSSHYPYVVPRNPNIYTLHTVNFVGNSVVVGYNNYLDYRGDDWSNRRNYNQNSRRFNHTNYGNYRWSADHGNRHLNSNRREFSRVSSDDSGAAINCIEKAGIRESSERTGVSDSSRDDDNAGKYSNHEGNSRNLNSDIDRNNNCSPPPAPYSPRTRPIPNISSPVSQVQFYSTGGTSGLQSRSYQHQYQQQQPGQRRYPSFGQSIGSGRKNNGQSGASDVLRRPKKMQNGGALPNCSIVSAKLREDNSIGGGGGGDAAANSQNSRSPITPPFSPRTHSVNPNSGGGAENVANNSNVSNDASQIDSCHRMQALTL